MREDRRNRNPNGLPGLRTTASEEIHVIGVAMNVDAPTQRVTVIRPTRGWKAVNWRELWAYRELLYFLVWRDIKVRYKQTVLGVLWVIIQPLLMALIFTFVFGRLAGITIPGIPFLLFAFASLLPWNLFTKGLAEGSTSLVSNERLVTKVYFPRLLLPAAAVVAGLVDFTIGLGVLAALIVYFGIVPSLAFVAFPAFVLATVIAAIGIAFLLSAIDARYRDVRYTLPFLTMFLLFATPIFYPLSFVPDSWRWVYALNPMVGVVEGFRWSLFGSSYATDGGVIGISLAVVAILFLSGVFYFKRTESRIADTV